MNWKRWARAAGAFVALVAAVFVARRLIALEIWYQSVDWGNFAWAFAWAVVAYAVAVFLLALAWAMLLGRQSPPVRLAAAWYLMAQFGKYLPGNIAHLAGRHVLFMRAGVPQARLLAAAATEAALLAGCALALAAGLAPASLTMAMGDTVPFGGVAWAVVAGLVVAGAGALLVMRALKDRRTLVASAAAITLYLLFFAVSGGILVGLGGVFGSLDSVLRNWPLIVAACSAAWLCGFVVPGAPGGLGVREGILVLLLSPAMGNEAALLMALAYRGVTIAGDGIAALAGAALLKARARKQIPG